MVERNMCDAVMRGIVVPPGSRAISRALDAPPALRRMQGLPQVIAALHVRRARHSSSWSGYCVGALPADNNSRGSLTLGSFGLRLINSTRNSQLSP